jgi:hypothetical protein
MQQSSPHTEGEGSDSVWENPWTLERTAYGWMPLDTVVCTEHTCKKAMYVVVRRACMRRAMHIDVRRAHMQKAMYVVVRQARMQKAMHVDVRRACDAKSNVHRRTRELVSWRGVRLVGDLGHMVISGNMTLSAREGAPVGC